MDLLEVNVADIIKEVTHMERKLPIIKIHDTDFVVDVANLDFREVRNPSNKISFFALKDNGDHLTLLYDKSTKNAYKGMIGELGQKENLELVKLPPLIELDRIGVVQFMKSHQAFNQKKNSSLEKSEIKFIELRQLPIIKVDNIKFFVDVNMEEFRQVDAANNKISFNDIKETGDHLEFYFDRNSKNIFKGTEQERAARNDVKFVKLPSYFKLDPVGMRLLIQNLIKKRDRNNLTEKGAEPKSTRKRKGRRM